MLKIEKNRSRPDLLNSLSPAGLVLYRQPLAASRENPQICDDSQALVAIHLCFSVMSDWLIACWWFG